MTRRFHVVICGDGVAGALAAALLSDRLPSRDYRLTIAPAGTPTDDAWGHIEPTLPSLGRLHAELGITEEALIRAGSSFSLGAAYSGWSHARATYFLPFGDIGAPLGGVAFHQLAARLNASGRKLSLADYSVAAMLAQTGRFAPPSNDPRSPLSTYAYGLHLDVESYRDALLDMAARREVEATKAPVARARPADDGSLAAVVLSNGEIVEGDFFIDATGSRALLLSTLAGYERISWTRWLPHDRSVELLTNSPHAPATYSHHALAADGLSRVVPAGRSVSQIRLYSSSEIAPEEAESRLRAEGMGEPISRAVHRQFCPGRAAAPWLGNCLALGAAAAQIAPQAPTALHLIQSGLERLLLLFPRDRVCTVEAAEYCRAQTLETDRCRDFALLPDRLSGRLGEGPTELEDKIAQFRRSGHVDLLDGDIFEEQDWAAAFDGVGLAQERYSLLADALPMATLEAQLDRMRQVMIKAVATVPAHAETLDRIRRKNAA